MQQKSVRKILSIGWNPVSRVRRLMGISQTEMAQILGTSKSAMSHRESQKNTTVKTLMETLDGLGVKARLVVELPNGEKTTFKWTSR